MLTDQYLDSSNEVIGKYFFTQHIIKLQNLLSAENDNPSMDSNRI